MQGARSFVLSKSSNRYLTSAIRPGRPNGLPRYDYVYTGNEAVEKESYLMHALVLAGVMVLATFTGLAITSCTANRRHARYMEAMDAEGGLPLSGVDELLSRVEELHPNDPEEDEEDYDIYLDSPEEPFSIDYYNYFEYYDCLDIKW